MKTADHIVNLANCHHGGTTALGNGITAYKAAVWAIATADDLVETMQAAGSVILAAEQIAKAAEEIATTMRRTLAETMLETGCPQVMLPHHKVSVSDPAPKLRVENTKLIPPTFMKQPPPVPDMAAIKAAINKGATVPGVGYGNGGIPYVSFHARKD